MVATVPVTPSPPPTIVPVAPSPSPTIAPTAEPEVPEAWEYWQAQDVKGLDPWGDNESQEIDLIALYEKDETDFLAFRLDLMDIQSDSITPVYFAIDFKDGGSTQFSPEGNAAGFDIEWDLLVMVSGAEFTLYDPTFTEIPDELTDSILERYQDFVSFRLAKSTFTGWDGSPFLMQALATTQDGSGILDITSTFRTDDTTGRAKLILRIGNSMLVGSPSAVGWYDAYEFERDLRPGERRGLRYILDAVEKYELPLTINDLRIEILPANEYLGINNRFRTLAGRGLLELMTTLDYGHFMVWQPDDVDARTIELAKSIHSDMDIPVSPVFYPYESMLTPADIRVIQDAGYEAIYGMDQYRYWFGWDYSEASINIVRKIHVINGVKFIFDPRIGNFQGFYPDERWGEIDWSTHNETDQFIGTDHGLDLWWRRILQDMAMDPDQEQFFSIGTDMQYTQWFFADVAENNFRWLAFHPWIEVTTYSDILAREWDVIDHGTLDLADDELLIQYQPAGDTHYNAYFPQHYYGGISDGHSPLIPAGVEIESYYDYVPYLRGGEPIPSGRIMGDDKTPGSIIYETLANLRRAPDNDLTRLAWLSYLMNTGEQTFHEGAELHPDIKRVANFVSQVNKLAYAARWTDQAERGELSPVTQMIEQDLDLDGEMEYILQNDQVLGIFENDGGRLEYAFVYDPEHGPIQLVWPGSQYTFAGGGDDYLEGEASLLVRRPGSVDGAFVDDLGEDGFYEYDVYGASHDENSLTFVSGDGKIAKTYTLEGDTIQAHYQIAPGEKVDHLFQLSVNPLAIFRKDWVRNFSPAAAEAATGWQMGSGGLALVNWGDAIFDSTHSFLLTPTLCFPCSSVQLNQVGGSQGQGDISLTLRAIPGPVAPAHTATQTPVPCAVSQAQVIYDDKLGNGWTGSGYLSTIHFQSTTMVNQGDFSIETVATDAWGSLSLTYKKTIDTSGLRSLVFQFNPGTIINLNLSVTIFSGNKNLTYVYINDYLGGVPLQKNTWVKVIIPLADVNPADAAFDRFYFESEIPGTFFIDDIRLACE